jgi:predicted dehydrogenase
LALAQIAKTRGVKNGVVQDKLFLPGLRKLQRLVSSGFFGRILSVRAEFGYWVFDGYLLPGQRPSWNYRSEDGGGIILDMFCHWRYVLESLFGPVQSVVALGATNIPARADEQGRSYEANADDAAYAIFELEKGTIAQINSSWCVRVYRDELFSLQVDGTHGSAVAGLRQCKVQPRVCTPLAVWNPDLPDTHDFFADWSEVPDNQVFDNAFKAQWELFLRHVVEGGPFPHSLLDGAKGVQLAEAGMQSWRERRWVDLPELTLR